MNCEAYHFILVALHIRQTKALYPSTQPVSPHIPSTQGRDHMEPGNYGHIQESSPSVFQHSVLLPTDTLSHKHIHLGTSSSLSPCVHVHLFLHRHQYLTEIPLCVRLELTQVEKQPQHIGVDMMAQPNRCTKPIQD